MVRKCVPSCDKLKRAENPALTRGTKECYRVWRIILRAIPSLASPRRVPHPHRPIRLPTRAVTRKTARVSKRLHRNVGVVSLLTAVSRVLGLARDSLAAAVLGAGMVNAAFVTAFRLPNLFRRLLGEGALTAAFLPTLQQELHARGRAGAFALLSQVVSWLAVVTGGLVAVAMLVFSQSRLLAGHDEKWHLAADLTVLLFPYLAFVCLAAALNAALNVLERFTEPALSPIWLNLCMIASLGGAGLHWAETDLGRVRWLCAGVLAGGFLQMAVPALVLMREGWRPRADLSLSPQVREIARLMTPGFFGTAIYQINIFVGSILAYSLADSAAPTLLFYANRLMELPVGVFAIAVSTVVYPLIARHAAEKKFSALADDYRRGVRLILLINVPAAVGLALLSGPITRLLFRHGNFTDANAQAMGLLLPLFAVGLPFFSITSLTVRAFYALKDTTTPVRVAAVDFALNLVLSLVLMRWLGAAGLVLASTGAIVVQTLLLQRALTRHLPELTLAPLARDIGKIAVATLVMGALVWIGREFIGGISQTHSRRADVLIIGAVIPGAVAAYFWLLRLLRFEGAWDLGKVRWQR
jgi:putative peptidoglycan lipid II flippase